MSHPFFSWGLRAVLVAPSVCPCPWCDCWRKPFCKLMLRWTTRKHRKIRHFIAYRWLRHFASFLPSGPQRCPDGGKARLPSGRGRAGGHRGSGISGKEVGREREGPRTAGPRPRNSRSLLKDVGSATVRAVLGRPRKAPMSLTQCPPSPEVAVI